MYLEEIGGLDVRTEIHQAVLSQFCLQGEFFIEKLLFKDKGSIILMCVNRTPVIRCLTQNLKVTPSIFQMLLSNISLFLSWCCSGVLDCTLLHSIALHFNISLNVLSLPLIISYF